jgi:large subunit ribosomal protein L4
LWKGGGVTFGPQKDENYSRKINKKIRRKALLMVLSSKVIDKELIILDELKISEAKTKLVANIISKNFKKEKKPHVLLALSKKDNNIVKATKNIVNLKTILSDSLNVIDLLSFKYLLLDKESIGVIEKTYGNI